MKLIKLSVISAILFFFMVSCGSVPVPKTSIAAKTKITHKAKKRYPRVIKKTPTKKSSAVVKPLPGRNGGRHASDALSVQEYMQNAISFLQVGQAQRARRELQAVLTKQPANKEARMLLRQIDTAPRVYFSAQQGFFFYKTQHGDSLSTIAKKFLRDPYKFYILARYNNIRNPGRLEIGKTIKIPGKRPKSLTLVGKSKKKQADLKLAQKHFDSGRYQKAIVLLEKMLRGNAKDTKSRNLLVLSYTKYAKSWVEKNDFGNAQMVIEKALRIKPKDRTLRSKLKDIENWRKADRLYESGLESLQAGEEDRAYGTFRQVLKLNPDHTLAKKQIVNIKADVIDTYHKQAMKLYRKQQLDGAIEIWDKVLALNSDHELAKLFRARALELKERLKKLGAEWEAEKQSEAARK